jgi:hypothetical protein
MVTVETKIRKNIKDPLLSEAKVSDKITPALRRRLTSRLQPLHTGMGFGSADIRERALTIARRAPLVGSKAEVAEVFSPASSSSEKPSSAGQAPVSIVEKEEKILSVVLPHLNEIEVSASAEQNKKTRIMAQVAKVGQVPSIKTFLTAPRRLQPPSVSQSLVAWFFDTLVVLSCLTMGFMVSASVPLFGLLTQKFPILTKLSFIQAQPQASQGWLMLVLQTVTLSSLLLFLIQTFAGLLFSASLGRAIVNVRIATSDGYRSKWSQGFSIGLGEMIQWPFAFGLLNAIVSPEHNFLVRSVRWMKSGVRY